MTYRASERHPLVDAFLSPLRRAGLDVVPDIGPGDEMYRYLLALRHGARDRALVDYFRSGHVAAAVLAPLVRALDAPAPVRVLDFAAGWGRVTRFLRPMLPEARIWVSDISPGSVEFQCKTLGVEGFPSALRPEDLEAPGDGFDVILVSSLFTHLPRATFRPWLARLWDLLAPGGTLLFTTHDLSTLRAEDEALTRAEDGEDRAEREGTDDGFRYLARSEIDTLDKREYGETWVSEDFVAARLAELSPTVTDRRRIPHGLWSFQDLYIARRGEALPELPFDPGPDGRVETASWEESPEESEGDRLWVAGWATEADGAPARLEITLNGHPAGVFERVPWGDDDTAEVGFRGWIGPPASDGDPTRGLWPTDVLHLRAITEAGRDRTILLSTVADLLAELRERDLRRRLAFAEGELFKADAFIRGHTEVVRGLELRMDHMRASKFWKLHDAWWGLRKKVRGR